MTVFGDAYSALYDLTYAGKDYAAEAQRVLELFAACGEQGIDSLLDLGCGTGGHAVEFARRGVRVTGVDRSADMLARAESRVRDEGLDIEFVEGDLTRLDLQGRRFDAGVMMFAVFGYMTDNDAAVAALRGAAAHLRSGGLLALDVWYGPAVVALGPEDRWRVEDTDQGRLVRASSGALDVLRHCCDVRIRSWLMREDRVVVEADESHRMRFYFPLELELLADAAGMEVVLLRDFTDVDRPPAADSWNIFAVLRCR